MRQKFWLFLAIALLPSVAFAQANGKLQIHFMDVGQGDGAVLISPGGEIVLFDNGVRNDCERVRAYLQQLGITQIDYHIASHYHDDHIGCTASVLGDFPLKKQAFDRGGTYDTATFRNYTNIIGGLRRTAIEGSGFTLDKNSQNPVRIEFAALNGNGVPTSNENDLSLTCVIRYGQFDALIAGDLSGYKEGGYKDVETSVAPKIGQVEVYKVNHHGSQYSSNPFWLATIRPKIGIISCGEDNKHRHPTKKCMDRLHAENIISYWTEAGNEAIPAPGRDKVGGSILVEIGPAQTTFTVTYGLGSMDSYQVWNPVGPAGTPRDFAWSKRATVYHFADCSYVKNISVWNLETNSVPPTDRLLHIGCPR